LGLKTIKRRFKRWIKKWLVSENLLRAYNHYRADKLQKFWFGRPAVAAPPLEMAYFRKAGLASRVVRRLDDYRSAALIDKKAELPLESRDDQPSLQLAVSPAKDWFPGQVLRLTLGGQMTQIRDLPMEKWFDIRLGNAEKANSLVVEADAPIEITMPRPVKHPSAGIVTKEPRHIVILVLDAWMGDVPQGCHPLTGESSLTPNIDHFFSRGFRAKNGISSGQWTLPAVGSLFSGIHVSRHRMFHPRRWQEFDPNRRLLPEYFQRAGYHTLCGSAVSRITPAFGHHRGFDRFLYHFAAPGYSYQHYDPAIWMQEIIGHMEAHYGDRTFSYFQFPDTHPAWNIPPETRYFYLGRHGSTSGNIEPFLRSKSHDPYDIPEQAYQIYSLRLAELDRMIGGVFDYAQRRFGDEALIVVTADHGMRLPYVSEAHRNDEPFLTDIRVKVPMYLRGLGVPECSFDGLCAPNLDIPLTLLKIARIKPESDDFDGVDILDPESRKRREYVASEYIYAGVYEIAIRGYDHCLFLKYKIDDLAFKVLSEEPLYAGLYPLDTPSYGTEFCVTESKPDIVKALHRIAVNHMTATGLMEKKRE
jgi:arylsulfatase A-like enzyme